MSKDKNRKDQPNGPATGATTGMGGQNQQQKTAQKSGQANNGGKTK